MDLVEAPVAELLRLQAGVVSRSQLFERGVSEGALRRLLRRRELVLVVPGVYVDHTGALTWLQRAWVAVLALWPAALCHSSALRAVDGPGRRDLIEPIHVAVDRVRSPAAPSGVRLHYLADLEAKVQWNATPPRVRIEHAVLDVAAEAISEMRCIATLADAVQARCTTPARLRATLDARVRIARRSLMEGVLSDVGSGTCSLLERGYLDLVERPHGLPRGLRQLLQPRCAPSYSDVEYPAHGVRVELDGRLFHDSASARDHDLERDLDGAVDSVVTVRLGWGQVYDRGCSTARKVAVLLESRGWDGRVHPCPRCATSSLRVAG